MCRHENQVGRLIVLRQAILGDEPQQPDVIGEEEVPDHLFEGRTQGAFSSDQNQEITRPLAQLLNGVQ